MGKLGKIVAGAAEKMVDREAKIRRELREQKIVAVITEYEAEHSGEVERELAAVGDVQRYVEALLSPLPFDEDGIRVVNREVAEETICLIQQEHTGEVSIHRIQRRYPFEVCIDIFRAYDPYEHEEVSPLAALSGYEVIRTDLKVDTELATGKLAIQPSRTTVTEFAYWLEEYFGSTESSK